MSSDWVVVRLAGLEPAAHSLGNCCSIHLSYRRNPDIIALAPAIANNRHPFVPVLCLFCAISRHLDRSAPVFGNLFSTTQKTVPSDWIPQ